jgi:hypothetical protein
MPIDANNVNFEQAMVRFLVLLHTKGKVISATTKAPMYAEHLADVAKGDSLHFEGISDIQRERLLKNWINSDFATNVREGNRSTGPARIANLKPLHMSTIKLLDPRVRSQDRDASFFLYNVFKGSEIINDDSFLISFLQQGTIKEGQFNLKLDPKAIDSLDIETLFLLRILEHFKVDLPDSREKKDTKERQVIDYICQAHKELFLIDTLMLLAYKNTVPRRELFQYIAILFSFHTALFAIKTFSLIKNVVATKSTRCSHCKAISGNHEFEKLGSCQFHPDIFVDLTNGQDRTCDFLAKQRVEKHYSEMYQYFRAHYRLKKLNDFAFSQGMKDLSLEELIKSVDNPQLEPHFGYLNNLIFMNPDNQDDPDLEAIRKAALSNFDKHIEILCQDKSNWKNLVSRHKKMMKDLCNMNRDDGFLHGGRGKQRKYVLGNQLLEVLVQIAVVGADSHRFKTQPITITRFVEWIRNRYGLLVDTTGTSNESPEIARALEANYSALKERLRQLGFFTDLSDASNSQVIRPRFPIEI